MPKRWPGSLDLHYRETGALRSGCRLTKGSWLRARWIRMIPFICSKSPLLGRCCANLYRCRPSTVERFPLVILLMAGGVSTSSPQPYDLVTLSLNLVRTLRYQHVPYAPEPNLTGKIRHLGASTSASLADPARSKHRDVLCFMRRAGLCPSPSP